MSIRALLATVLVSCMCFAGCEELSDDPGDANGKRPGNEHLAPNSPWTPWTRNARPIFTAGDVMVAGDPSIVHEGPQYRMYYTTIDYDKMRPVIAQATSADGLNWQEVPSQGKIKGLTFRGRDKSWDDGVECVCVVPRDGEYWMYYSGYHYPGTPADGFPSQLSLATSKDGVNFKRAADEPLITNTPDGPDNDAVYSPCVFPYEGGWAMIYVGHNITGKKGGEGVRLLGATSRDGKTWTKRKKPVLDAPSNLDWAQGVAEPALLKGPDNQYYLFFTGCTWTAPEQRQIGIARGPSPWGPWTVNPQPIIAARPGSFEGQTLAPYVEVEGDTVRMWYLAVNPSNEQHVIGYAEAKWPLYQEKR